MVRFKLIFFIFFLVIFISSVFFIAVIQPLRREIVFLQAQTIELTLLRQSFSVLEASLKKKLHDVQTLKYYVDKNKTLPFLEQQLQSAHISAEAIRFSDVNQSEEVHAMLMTNYSQFVQFLALLSQSPNAFKVTDVSIQPNKVVVLFRKNVWSATSSSPIKFLNNQNRLEKALKPVLLPSLSRPLHMNLNEVQSPFIPRKELISNVHNVNFLLQHTWRCVGKLEDENQIRGVFLTSLGNSEYFGLNFSWRNSDWIVIVINAHEVILQNQHTHELIHLLYQDKK